MDINLQNNIIDIAENNYHFLKSLENVLGVGLGFKTINYQVTDEPCIHVLVQRKIDESFILDSKNIIPKEYMGIKTDVLEIGNPKFRSLTDKVRPLEGGYSIAPSISSSAGTLSCIVTKLDSDNRRNFYILSNNHVLADQGDIPLETPILQPAKRDGGKLEDIIAFLSEFIPLEFSFEEPYPINYVDAAIAKITDEKLISTLIGYIGNVKGVDDAIPNTFVKKSGRTTGYTEGIITTTNVTIDLSGGTFKQQILADLKNSHGDSGSLLLNENNKAVGLLFEGKGDTIAIASPIKNVLTALNVKLVIDCS